MLPGEVSRVLSLYAEAEKKSGTVRSRVVAFPVPSRVPGHRAGKQVVVSENDLSDHSCSVGVTFGSFSTTDLVRAKGTGAEPMTTTNPHLNSPKPWRLAPAKRLGGHGWVLSRSRSLFLRPEIIQPLQLTCLPRAHGIEHLPEASLFRAKINSDYNDFVARVALEVVDSA